jgi:uncharacterized Zn finger protein
MSFYAWKPYVPVARRREQAAKKLAKMQKKGTKVSPVFIEGRTIASSFWGKAWCENLERYSDYASRLPRGRTYVRNGSVLDLQVAKGEITAKVSGSELYTIKITITAVAVTRWKSICSDCAGSIDSVVELLQGRLAKGVMERVCRQGEGLFPGPKEIKLSCSCPDWADMCKHVAATLYGVGARLDKQPELLFALRGVDAKDMVVGAGTLLAAPKRAASERKVLADDNMAALFGLDMAVEGEAPSAAGAAAVAAAVDGIGSAPRQVGERLAPNAAARRKTPEKRHPTSTRPPAMPPRAAGAKSKGPAKGTAQNSAARKKAVRGRMALPYAPGGRTRLGDGVTRSRPR